MSNSESLSTHSNNSSEKAVFITIKDDTSSPSIVIDSNLDNEFSSSSSHSPKKNHSNSIIELENYRCDSPITMSYNGSRSGSYDGSQHGLDDGKQTPPFNQSLSLEDIANITQENLTKVLSKNNNHFKKYSKKDIEKTVEKYYNVDDNKFTNELDVITTYVRGQKNLYIQSKNINQWKLNLLMIPSILITFFIRWHYFI